MLVAVACAVLAACSATTADVVASRSDAVRPSIDQAQDPVGEAAGGSTEDPEGRIDPDATGGGQQSSVDEPADTEIDVEPADDEPADDDESLGAEQLDQAEVDELIAELTDGGFCDPSDVRDDGVVTAMHFVVEGRLQMPCYVDQPNDGDDVADVVIDDDPRLIEAWESLVAITPIELVSDISLLAGYEPCPECSTLAFVTTLDEDSTFFLLAVDVVSGASDPDELRLTMMHELTHVFAQEPGAQLIVSSGPFGCDTFYNGAGCFTEDSYLWAWIQEFWPLEIRDTLPRDGSVGTDDEAFERCDLDAAYTGTYAAVHPEEDFAETFSAYVYDVEASPALGAKYAFFDRYPEFVAIRDSARALGLPQIEGNFGGCG